MSALPNNGMVTGAGRALDAQARRAALAGEAYVSLKAELLDAIAAGDASAEIRTPGYGYDSTLSQVLCDDLFGDDARASVVVALLRDAMRGEDVQLRAALLLSNAAERHARAHKDEALADDEGDD